MLARLFLGFLVIVLTIALHHPWHTNTPLATHSKNTGGMLAAAHTAASTTARSVPDPQEPPTDDVEPSQTVMVEKGMYSTPPYTLDAVNQQVRPAVVNILCTATGNDLNPISGSGVIISGNGLVLTNAHIGQYVLLQDASPIAIECFVRSGSPARTEWKPRIVYISNDWVSSHAKDIRIARPTGTGENDFSLLALEPIDTPLSLPVPYISPDTRNGVIVTDETALIASYPAGFAGAVTVYNNLSLVSTVGTIKRLYTFSEETIDLLSLGGVIVAQQGSSGGAVVNAWGKLVGLIVTSSDAQTTAERDLRALTLAHIDRTLTDETGLNVSAYINADPRSTAAAYRISKARELAALITQAVLAAP